MALETQLRKKAEENEVNKISLQQAEAGMIKQRAALESLQVCLEEKAVALERAEEKLIDVKAKKNSLSKELHTYKQAGKQASRQTSKQASSLLACLLAM